MRIRKIISGGQTGADQAGLFVGKRFGLETGGFIPKGHKTLVGSRPDLSKLYGLVEDNSEHYAPRTLKNVMGSDGTIRLAGDFHSKGEICTLKAIEKCKKPYFDVDLSDFPKVEEFIKWSTDNRIEILNVSGNSEQTYQNAFSKSVYFLMEAFFSAGYEMIITDDEILRSIGLDHMKSIIYTDDKMLVEHLKIRRIGVKSHQRNIPQENLEKQMASMW